MEQYRKYFLKFAAVLLIINIFQFYGDILTPWRLQLRISLLLILALAFLGFPGKNIYGIVLKFRERTLEASRFFFIMGFVLILVGYYRLIYVSAAGATTDLSSIRINLLLESDFTYFILSGVILILLGLSKAASSFMFNLWMKFAHLLQAVVSKIILTLLFILTIIPISIIARLMGKRFLDVKLDKAIESYWNERPESTFVPERYEKQF